MTISKTKETTNLYAENKMKKPCRRSRLAVEEPARGANRCKELGSARPATVPRVVPPVAAPRGSRPRRRATGRTARRRAVWVTTHRRSARPPRRG